MTTINAFPRFTWGLPEWSRHKPSWESDWRASLVPAAAVIPAPIVYCKVVVIKTLVVECKQSSHDLRSLIWACSSQLNRNQKMTHYKREFDSVPNSFTLIKSRCLKQNLLLMNDEAWYKMKNRTEINIELWGWFAIRIFQFFVLFQTRLREMIRVI